MADNINRLNQICDSLYKRFWAKGSIVGSEFRFLGMAIKIDRAVRRVTVNQHGYLSRILEKFDMAGCNGRLNPMDSGIRLRKRKPYNNTTIQQYNNTPIHEYTNTPIHQYTNTPIQQYNNTTIQQYTDTRIHQYTDTPIYQYNNAMT
jgi:hypothetical protein